MDHPSEVDHRESDGHVIGHVIAFHLRLNLLIKQKDTPHLDAFVPKKSKLRCLKSTFHAKKNSCAGCFGLDQDNLGLDLSPAISAQSFISEMCTTAPNFKKLPNPPILRFKVESPHTAARNSATKTTDARIRRIRWKAGVYVTCDDCVCRSLPGRDTGQTDELWMTRNRPV